MGFWNKLKNWAKGKGWKEETETTKPSYEEDDIGEIDDILKQEQEAKKRKRENEDIKAGLKKKQPEEDEEKPKETPKTEKKTKPKELTKKEEEIIKEAKETITTTPEEIKESQETEKKTPIIKPYINQETRKEIAKQTVAEINEKTNAIISEEYENSQYYTGEIEGQNYAQYMKTSIMGSMIKIDEALAETIVTNADKFKGRFETDASIILTDGQMININFPAGLINEIHPEVLEEFPIGTNTDASSINKRIIEMIERIQNKYGNGGYISQMPQFDKEGRLEVADLRFRTTFK